MGSDKHENDIQLGNALYNHSDDEDASNSNSDTTNQKSMS